MEATGIATIAALGLPLLCFDTCTALDLMRDPTRDDARIHEREAALVLLGAAEGSAGLVTVVADQVAFEFRENVRTVEDETRRSLARLKAQVGRVDAVAAVYGGVGRAALDHLDDHVARARAVADRCIQAARSARQGDDIADRALARLNQGRTPARRGKDSMKDCVVIEIYLDVVSRIRTAGFAGRAVFTSSNTKDYAGEAGAVMRPDLARECEAPGMSYAPNLAAARFMLGLRRDRRPARDLALATGPSPGEDEVIPPRRSRTGRGGGRGIAFRERSILDGIARRPAFPGRPRGPGRARRHAPRTMSLTTPAGPTRPTGERTRPVGSPARSRVSSTKRGAFAS